MFVLSIMHKLILAKMRPWPKNKNRYSYYISVILVNSPDVRKPSTPTLGNGYFLTGYESLLAIYQTS